MTEPLETARERYAVARARYHATLTQGEVLAVLPAGLPIDLQERVLDWLEAAYGGDLVAEGDRDRLTVYRAAEAGDTP